MAAAASFFSQSVGTIHVCGCANSSGFCFGNSSSRSISNGFPIDVRLLGKRICSSSHYKLHVVRESNSCALMMDRVSSSSNRSIDNNGKPSNAHLPKKEDTTSRSHDSFAMSRTAGENVTFHVYPRFSGWRPIKSLRFFFVPLFIISSLILVSIESALILIRHGESLWNEKNLFTGCVDEPLTKKGIEEALQAGIRICNIPIDVIYTSTLIRAQMTAMLVMTQHRHKKVATPRSRCSKGVSTYKHEDQESHHNNNKIPNPNNPNSSNNEKNNTSKRFEYGDPFASEPLALSRNSSVLLNLISCGNLVVAKANNMPTAVNNSDKNKNVVVKKRGINDNLHKGVLCQSAVKVAEEEDNVIINYMSENPRFGNFQSEEKE
ncbi:hypothetical protein KPL71_022288 [Citrus sinensis]|uniref:Uncharacterized protein n=1 Tax=Citrus sinensis TaxID=2711 RepID=A0ACB8JLU0_CITSI|nr:hypothetical protein KPL71_022288 [Citrus sinensis]